MEKMSIAKKKLNMIAAAICFLILAVSCITTENDTSTVPTQTRDDTAGITIITKNGGHLAWSKKNNKIAFDRLGKNKYFDLWIMNRDGSDKQQLTWFHTPGHPHDLNKSFAVAADFDWSPDGTRIAALVLTNRPETGDRGSGLNVLIDLPEN
jgi:Tol biopolymer transport system component